VGDFRQCGFLVEERDAGGPCEARKRRAVGLPPGVSMTLDGASVKPGVESQRGMWAWYTLSVGPGQHTVSLAVAAGESVRIWTGKATGYYICDQSLRPESVSIEMKASSAPRPMPPLPGAPGTFRVTTNWGRRTSPSAEGDRSAVACIS